MLITPFSPSHGGGGAVILRSLLRNQEAATVWATLQHRDAVEPPAAFRCATRKSHESSWLARPAALSQGLARLAADVNAQALWVVAHGPVVPLIERLRTEIGLPLHLSVHDDPAWSVTFRSRRELGLTPWIHQQFGRAVRCADSIDVISGPMRGELLRRYGVDSIVVHRVLDDPIEENRAYVSNEQYLEVGLLGSVYSAAQFSYIIATTARAARLLGTKARLNVVGTRVEALIQLAARAGDVDVNFTGHLPESQGIAILRRQFVLFLGYPFGIRERMIRRTSFPAKLATYVQAARPILLTAPYASSVLPLTDFGDYVIPRLDQDVDAGARSLVAAWRNPVMHASRHLEAERVRERYFGRDNRRRLFHTLNQLRSKP
jgi:hypothetical protein